MFFLLQEIYERKAETSYLRRIDKGKREKGKQVAASLGAITEELTEDTLIISKEKEGKKHGLPKSC